MGWLTRKNKTDVLDTIDSVVDPAKVQRMAETIAGCFTAIRAQWGTFSEPERNIILAWGKRLGGKMISAGMSLSVMSEGGGDEAANKILQLIQEQKSQTMGLFIRTVVASVTGEASKADNDNG